MNIEFIIHGVLSSGQSVTDQNDKDYYKPFYCEQQESILMTVEVVDRPHGVSTYYNYLRYNNVISSRKGSYFGMTVRVDGSYCLDVKNMYLILDNLFNKMIVGKILRQVENNYEYIVDSFSVEKEIIEQQFSNMFGSFFSSSDFKDISRKNVSAQKKLTINPYDLTPSIVSDVFLSGVKLYLSTSYPSKQTQSVQAIIDQAKTEASRRVKDAEEQLNLYIKQHESNSQSSSAKIARLESEKAQLIKEKDELNLRLSKCGKEQDIINSVKSIKSPIAELATLFAARFQEDDKVDPKNPKKTLREKQQANKEKVWLPMANCILGIVTLFVLLFSIFGSTKSGNSGNVEDLQKEIKTLQDSITKITNPQGAMVLESGSDNPGTVEDTPDDDPVPIDYNRMKIRINIKGLNSWESELTLGKEYTFEIVGEDAMNVANGYWVVVEGNNRLDGNKMVASQPGVTVNATYYIGTNVVKERSIKIKQ